MPSGQSPEHLLREALRAIIEGKEVKRIRHDLVYQGRDLAPMFLEELARSGYRATTVDAVQVVPGERVPAFVVEERVAHFGWVFWEQFTSWKRRKLWGSEARDRRGDWELQIPPTRPTTIFANESLKLEMDFDHPPAL
jgi:hypothetical protein